MNPPCKTCIVLAACKARLSKFHIDKRNAYSIVSKLADKCPELTAFIKQHSNYSYNLSHRYHSVLFLTGISLPYIKEDAKYPVVRNIEDNKT